MSPGSFFVRWQALRLRLPRPSPQRPQHTQNLVRTPTHAQHAALYHGVDQSGVPYGKAGVMLFDLLERGRVQGSLLMMAHAEREARRDALMASLDAANRRYGRGTVKFAIEGLGKGVWALKQDHKSPAYTTEWDELAVVKC